MVYLSLSVKNIDSSFEFYSKKLGMFKTMADSRLICTVGPALIIDLYVIGTERHKNIFGCVSHQVSSFSISIKEHSNLEILDHLHSKGVEFEDVGNIAGRYLKFNDPSGNALTLVAHHEQIS